MPGFSFGGFEFGVILLDLMNEVRWRARLSNLNQLDDPTGSDSTAANERWAECINRAIEEFLETNPVLGRAISTIVLASGTTVYPIPSDLHGVGIAAVRYEDSGSDPAYDNRQIDFITYAEYLNLPLSWRNGDVTVPRPMLVTADPGWANLIFIPFPDSSRNVIVDYRQEPTKVTAAAIATPKTTVSVDSNSGQTVLSIAAVTGVKAGDLIIIGEGTAREEQKLVASVGASSVTLTANLTYSHTAVQADTVQVMIGEIPKRFQNVIAMHVAAALIQAIKPEEAAPLRAEHLIERDKAVNSIGRSLALTRGAYSPNSRYYRAIDYTAAMPLDELSYPAPSGYLW